MNRYFRAVLIVAAVSSILFSGCRRPASVRRCSGSVWATTYSIVYVADRNLDDSILSVIRRVEMSLSPFADSSLISRINRSETLIADSLVRRVFLKSQHINRCSSGSFDPTLSPLINLWGYGYRNSSSSPSDSQVDSAMRLVGINRCEMRGDSLIKAHPEMEFNFSAITKGYGCDLIGEMLRRNGVEDYMVEIGGEIALSGRNPAGEPWHIQIDDPTAADASAGGHRRLAVIEITDCGIATSGNYRNFREQGGRRTWHTIDPATGRPAVTPTLSATVIAPDCMTADALATSCMVMNPDSALSMIARYPGASAMIVVGPTGESEASDSGLRVVSTPNFPLH